MTEVHNEARSKSVHPDDYHPVWDDATGEVQPNFENGSHVEGIELPRFSAGQAIIAEYFKGLISGGLSADEDRNPRELEALQMTAAHFEVRRDSLDAIERDGQLELEVRRDASDLVERRLGEGRSPSVRSVYEEDNRPI